MADEKKTYLINIESNLQKYADEAAEAKKRVDELKASNELLKESGTASAAEIESNNAALRNAQKEYNQAKKMVDLQTAANKSEAGSRKQLGEILTLQMQALGKLGNAYTKDAQGIMRLNPLYVEQRKRIAETKQAILDYDKALNDGRSNVGRYGEAIGGAFQDAGSSIFGFTTIAGGVLIAVKAMFDGIKEAVMSTTGAINTMAIVAETKKQIFYDLINLKGFTKTFVSDAAGESDVKQVKDAVKELNRIRVENYNEELKIKILNKELQELRFEASNQTKTQAERLDILNKVKEKENEIVQIKVESLIEERKAVQKLLELRPNHEELGKRVLDLQGQIMDVYAQSDSTMRRIESQRTGIIQDEIEKRAKAQKDALDAMLALHKKNYEEAKKAAEEFLKKYTDLNTETLNELSENADKELKLIDDNAKRKIDIELENQKLKLQISEIGIENEFELKRKQLENDRIMEEKSGADINLINEKYSKLREVLAITESREKYKVYSEFAGAVAGIFGQHTIIAKAAAIAEATINTWLGATQALKTYPPPLSFAAAASQVAAGIGAIAKIVAVDTSGSTSMPTAITSTPAARSVTVNQVQSSILTNPQLSQSQLNSLPQNMLSASDIANAMRGLPPQIVTVEDINAKASEVNKIHVRANI